MPIAMVTTPERIDQPDDQVRSLQDNLWPWLLQTAGPCVKCAATAPRSSTKIATAVAKPLQKRASHTFNR